VEALDGVGAVRGPGDAMQCHHRCGACCHAVLGLLQESWSEPCTCWPLEQKEVLMAAPLLRWAFAQPANSVKSVVMNLRKYGRLLCRSCALMARSKSFPKLRERFLKVSRASVRYLAKFKDPLRVYTQSLLCDVLHA